MTARITILKSAGCPAVGCALLFLIGCQPDSILEAPLARIAETDARLNEIRLTRQKAEAKEREKSLAIREKTEAALAEADESEAALQDAKLELQTLNEEFATYRHAYRTKLRTDVLQTTFPTVEIPGGKPLKAYRVRAIENAEIHFAARGSTGRIPLSEAPPTIANFIRLEEEAKDRAAYPELIPRRDSDININAEAKLSLEETEALIDNPDVDAGRQHIRNAKVRLKAIYERREKELMKMSRELDKTRVTLTAKRQRHRDYNEYHRTNIRDRAIANLSRSIEKIDQRSRGVYEKVNALRDLMRKNR